MSGSGSNVWVGALVGYTSSRVMDVASHLRGVVGHGTFGLSAGMLLWLMERC